MNLPSLLQSVWLIGQLSNSIWFNLTFLLKCISQKITQTLFSKFNSLAAFRMKVHREVSGYSLFGGFLLFAHRKERNIYFIIVDLENRERERERERRDGRERREGATERDRQRKMWKYRLCGAHIFTNTHRTRTHDREKNWKGMRKEWIWLQLKDLSFLIPSFQSYKNWRQIKCFILIERKQYMVVFES